jgi:hypothetical protein
MNGWDVVIGVAAALLPAWLVLVVTFVLRSVVRRGGLDAVRNHWPGTEAGFAVLTGLTGLTSGT